MLKNQLIKLKIESKILIIAGSDSSGGAGIQADIKTGTSLGAYAMTAITAVTSQNTTGVSSIVPIPAKNISKQIEFTSSQIVVSRHTLRFAVRFSTGKSARMKVRG